MLALSILSVLLYQSISSFLVVDFFLNKSPCKDVSNIIFRCLHRAELQSMEEHLKQRSRAAENRWSLDKYGVDITGKSSTLFSY